MVNYSNAKIYKITSPQSDKVYIGSTTKQYLSQRMNSHRDAMKTYQKGTGRYTMSFEILKYEDAQIVLLEALPKCVSKDELRAREQDWIDANREICNNKYRAHDSDLPNIKKTYYVKNKTAIRERASKKFICECGGSYTRSNKSTHSKSTPHTTWISQKT